MSRKARTSLVYGFTLLELLLYVGIFSIIGALTVGVLLNTTSIQQRESASSDVTSQSQLVLERVKGLIRDSSLVELESNAPTSTLRLRMKDPLEDPTLVFSSAGKVYVQRGESSPQAVTDQSVEVDSLQFVKFSSYPGNDTVQIDFTIATGAFGNIPASKKTFRSAVARVSAAVFDSSILPGADNTYDIGLTSPQRWRNANFAGDFTVDTDTFFVNSVTNRVSIGTTTGVSSFDGSSPVGLHLYSPYTRGASFEGSSTHFGIDVNGLINSIPYFQLNRGNYAVFTIQGETNTSTAFRTGGVTATTALTILGTEGYVGIGTSTPLARLHVKGPGGWGDDTTFNSDVPLLVQADNTAFGILNNNGLQVFGIDILSNGGTPSTRGIPTFYDKYDGSWHAGISLKNGNVGMGTSNPQAKLDVSGNIIADDPTADDHVATKGWIEAQGGLGGGGGTDYLGNTIATYTGDLGGFAGANAKCQAEYPNSHICSQSEMINSGATSFGGSNGWAKCEVFPNGDSRCATVSQDLNAGSGMFGCNSYTSALSTDQGVRVNASGTPTKVACDVARSIHCCG